MKIFSLWVVYMPTFPHRSNFLTESSLKGGDKHGRGGRGGSEKEGRGKEKRVNYEDRGKEGGRVNKIGRE